MQSGSSITPIMEDHPIAPLREALDLDSLAESAARSAAETRLMRPCGAHPGPRTSANGGSAQWPDGTVIWSQMESPWILMECSLRRQMETFYRESTWYPERHFHGGLLHGDLLFPGASMLISNQDPG